jgi:hypothetical protein
VATQPVEVQTERPPFGFFFFLGVVILVTALVVAFLVMSYFS